MRAFLLAVITAMGRRLGGVVMGAVLLFVFGTGRAEALGRTSPTPILCTDPLTTTCTTKDIAIQIAKDGATALSHCVSRGHTSAGGYDDWTAKYVSHYVQNEGSAGESIVASYTDVRNEDGATLSCSILVFYWKPKECTAGSFLPSGSWSTKLGPLCHDGCIYDPVSDQIGTGNSLGKTIDGIGYFNVGGYATTNDTMACSVEDIVTPPQDSDGDGKSDQNDPSPHNPGNSGDNGDNPPDGDSDESGDGSGNGNKSSGGGSCSSPPSSSGDEIAAMIAYQTWATRCAIENAKNSDGSLKTGPANGSGSGDGSGNGNGNGQGTDMGPTNGLLGGIKGVMEAVKGGIDSLLGGVDDINEQIGGTGSDAGFEGDVAGINTDEEPPTEQEEEDPTADLKVIEDSGTLLDRLDSSGFLGGGACPADKSVAIGGGVSIPLTFGPICQLLAAVSGLVMAAAYLIAFKIMAA